MKNIKNISILSIVLVALLVGCAAKKQSSDTSEKDDITVAAYYFPNYHEDNRNASYHGNGWTEWELVKEAKPRYENHHQPNVPAWGYTDEADPVQMAQKIDAAADNGIDAFIFDWYMYEDGPFLDRGIDQGFLKAENTERINTIAEDVAIKASDADHHIKSVSDCAEQVKRLLSEFKTS